MIIFIRIPKMFNFKMMALECLSLTCRVPTVCMSPEVLMMFSKTICAVEEGHHGDSPFIELIFHSTINVILPT